MDLVKPFKRDLCILRLLAEPDQLFYWAIQHADDILHASMALSVSWPSITDFATKSDKPVFTAWLIKNVRRPAETDLTTCL